MVGKKYLGGDGACCLHQLIDSHRVGLVAGQEGDVDVLQIGHLGDILSVTCDIDAQIVEGEDIAVVTPLGVEHLAPLSVVVGRNGLNLDISGILDAIAVLQGDAVAEHVIDGCVREAGSGWRADTGDSLALEVILMFMGDEDDVGLRELCIVCLGLHI